MAENQNQREQSKKQPEGGKRKKSTLPSKVQK
jgi:hypothetical protein